MTDTQGKFLVAPPNMPDCRFQKPVIYMWKHDISGAGGVIINKKCNHPDFKHICQEGKLERLENINPPIYYGGPILNNLIGVLHTKDFQKLIITNLLPQIHKHNQKQHQRHQRHQEQNPKQHHSRN